VEEKSTAAAFPCHATAAAAADPIRGHSRGSIED
jgi:hypothetical protein